MWANHPRIGYVKTYPPLKLSRAIKFSRQCGKDLVKLPTLVGAKNVK